MPSSVTIHDTLDTSMVLRACVPYLHTLHLFVGVHILKWLRHGQAVVIVVN